jgi:hypothetical protein
LQCYVSWHKDPSGSPFYKTQYHKFVFKHKYIQRGDSQDDASSVTTKGLLCDHNSSGHASNEAQKKGSHDRCCCVSF